MSGKIGRPALYTNAMNHVVTLRLPDNDYSSLQKHAEVIGISVGQYIRRMIMAQ
jgi:predicted DNA binding CopG/RHH family protein